MELWQYILLAAVGLAAGFINVMAGGGSLLTMPVLIFLGLSPAMANGTNRIALLAQNATAVSTFYRKGFSDFKLSLSLSLCTIPGAIAGALLAVEIDPTWFKRLLAVVMVAVLLRMLFKKKTGQETTAEKKPEHPVLAHLGMVLVGFYGGFIQAGVGFILMAVLIGLLRLDLVRSNMHKVFIVGVYMVPSLAVFVLTDNVLWLAGVLLAVGTAAGAYLATTLQIKRGEGVVRVVFVVAVIAMSIRLLQG